VKAEPGKWAVMTPKKLSEESPTYIQGL